MYIKESMARMPTAQVLQDLTHIAIRQQLWKTSLPKPLVVQSSPTQFRDIHSTE